MLGHDRYSLYYVVTNCCVWVKCVEIRRDPHNLQITGPLKVTWRGRAKMPHEFLPESQDFQKFLARPTLQRGIVRKLKHILMRRQCSELPHRALTPMPDCLGR